MHVGRDGAPVVDPSVGAQRGFIQACVADGILRKQGKHGVILAVRRAAAIAADKDLCRWPPPNAALCGCCGADVILCGGRVRDHRWRDGAQRTMSTGSGCNTSLLELVDWLIESCHFDPSLAAELAEPLARFLGYGQALTPATFASKPPAVVAPEVEDASRDDEPRRVQTRSQRALSCPFEQTRPTARPGPGAVTVIAVDFESSKHPRHPQNEIVQMALKSSGGSFETYVLPDFDISDGAYDIHGISKQQLIDVSAPPFAAAAAAAFDWIEAVRGDGDVVFVAHNADFDRGLLYNELDAAGLDYGPFGHQWICTLELASVVKPESVRVKGALTLKTLFLEATKEPLRDGGHDASVDADAALRILPYLISCGGGDLDCFIAHFVAKRGAATVPHASGAGGDAPVSDVDTAAGVETIEEPPAKRRRVSPAASPARGAAAASDGDAGDDLASSPAPADDGPPCAADAIALFASFVASMPVATIAAELERRGLAHADASEHVLRQRLFVALGFPDAPITF